MQPWAKSMTGPALEQLHDLRCVTWWRGADSTALIPRAAGRFDSRRVVFQVWAHFWSFFDPNRAQVETEHKLGRVD
jgi:hypothetical protein